MAAASSPKTSGIKTNLLVNKSDEKPRPPTVEELLIQIENHIYDSVEHRASLLIAAWTCLGGQIGYFLCIESVFRTMYRESALLIFSGHWMKMDILYKRGLSRAILQYSHTMGGYVRGAEGLCSALVMAVFDPWGDPALGQMLRKEVLDTSKVNDFVRSEPPELLLIRIESLVNARCEEVAINLCRYCLKSDAPCFVDPECDNENWRLSFLEWLVRLLFRKRRLDDLVAETTNCTCHEGVRLIYRTLCSKEDDSEALSESLVNLFLVRDLLFKSNYCCTSDLMTLWCELQAKKQKSLIEIQDAAKNLLVGHASCSAQLYLFVDVLWKKFGISLLPLYLELYIRGLTSDLNFLEAARQNDQKEYVLEIENHMSSMYFKLSSLFTSVSREITLECLLSAFSLNPTREILDWIKKTTLQITKESGNKASGSASGCKHGKGPCSHNCSHLLPVKRKAVVMCDQAIQVGDDSFAECTKPSSQKGHPDERDSKRLASDGDKLAAKEIGKSSAVCDNSDTSPVESQRLTEKSSVKPENLPNGPVNMYKSIGRKKSNSGTSACDEVVNDKIENCKDKDNNPNVESTKNCNKNNPPTSDLNDSKIASLHNSKGESVKLKAHCNNIDHLEAPDCTSNSKKLTSQLNNHVNGLDHEDTLIESSKLQTKVGATECDYDGITVLKQPEISLKPKNIVEELANSLNGDPNPTVLKNMCMNGFKESEVSHDTKENLSNKRSASNKNDSVNNVDMGDVIENEKSIIDSPTPMEIDHSDKTKNDTITNLIIPENSIAHTSDSMSLTNSNLAMVTRKPELLKSQSDFTCFSHVVLDCKLPGVPADLLSDFVTVLESLRNKQLKSSNKWSQVKHLYEDYLEIVAEERSMILSAQQAESIDSEADSSSEVTVNDLEFHQSDDSIHEDNAVDKSQLLKRYMNSDKTAEMATYVNLADLQCTQIPLEKLFCTENSSSHPGHKKRHKRHRNHDKNPKKQILRKLHHGSRAERDMVKHKKRKKRKGKHGKGHTKKHHSTHNKVNKDHSKNKRKKHKLKKKKEANSGFISGDYCSDFSSEMLMRIVKEHSNSYSKTIATTSKHPQSASSTDSGEPARKKRKVSFDKKHGENEKYRDKHKHVKSKSDKHKNKITLESCKASVTNVIHNNPISNDLKGPHFLQISRVNKMEIQQRSVSMVDDSSNGTSVMTPCVSSPQIKKFVQKNFESYSPDDMMKMQLLMARQQAEVTAGTTSISTTSQSMRKYVCSKMTSQMLSLAQSAKCTIGSDSEASKSPTPNFIDKTSKIGNTFKPQNPPQKITANVKHFVIETNKPSYQLPSTSTTTVANTVIPVSGNQYSDAQTLLGSMLNSNIRCPTSQMKPQVSAISIPLNQSSAGNKFVTSKIIIPLPSSSSQSGTSPSNLSLVPAEALSHSVSGNTSHSSFIIVKNGGSTQIIPSGQNPCNILSCIPNINVASTAKRVQQVPVRPKMIKQAPRKTQPVVKKCLYRNPPLIKTNVLKPLPKVIPLTGPPSNSTLATPENLSLTKTSVNICEQTSPKVAIPLPNSFKDSKPASPSTQNIQDMLVNESKVRLEKSILEPEKCISSTSNEISVNNAQVCKNLDDSPIDTSKIIATSNEAIKTILKSMAESSSDNLESPATSTALTTSETIETSDEISCSVSVSEPDESAVIPKTSDSQDEISKAIDIKDTVSIEKSDLPSKSDENLFKESKENLCKDLNKNSIDELGNDSQKKPILDFSNDLQKESINELSSNLQEPMNDLRNDLQKEPINELRNSSQEEPINELSNDLQKEPINELSNSLQEEPTNEFSNNFQKEPINELSNSLQEEPINEFSNDLQKEPINELSNNLQEEPINELSNNLQTEPMVDLNKELKIEPMDKPIISGDGVEMGLSEKIPIEVKAEEDKGSCCVIISTEEASVIDFSINDSKDPDIKIKNENTDVKSEETEVALKSHSATNEKVHSPKLEIKNETDALHKIVVEDTEVALSPQLPVSRTTSPAVDEKTSVTTSDTTMESLSLQKESVPVLVSDEKTEKEKNKASPFDQESGDGSVVPKENDSSPKAQDQRKQLQPISSISIMASLKTSKEKSSTKSEGVAVSEVPTRSFTSISDAVRFSLMDMDDATDSVENQVLQSFQVSHEPSENSPRYENSSTNDGNERASSPPVILTTPQSSSTPDISVNSASQRFEGSVHSSETEKFSECQSNVSRSSTWMLEDSAITEASQNINMRKSPDIESSCESKEEEKPKKKKKRKERCDPEAAHKFWCEICHKGFFSAYNLRRHCRNVHKMALPKGTSDLPFASNAHGNQHIQQSEASSPEMVTPPRMNYSTQSSCVSPKGSDFLLHSPTRENKTQDFASKSVSNQHGTSIQSDFPMQTSPRIPGSSSSTHMSPSTSSKTAQSEFQMPTPTSVSSVHVSPNKLPNVAKSPSTPKFQRLPTPCSTAAVSPMSQISVCGQQAALQQQQRQHSQIQSPGLIPPVPSVPCQAQQMQNAQCPHFQSKQLAQQRINQLQLMHHASQLPGMQHASHGIQKQTPIQQFKKCSSSLSSSKLSETEQQQLQQTAQLAQTQQILANQQMQKIMQIRQNAIAASGVATQLSLGANMPVAQSPNVKAATQCFQNQLAVARQAAAVAQLTASQRSAGTNFALASHESAAHQFFSPSIQTTPEQSSCSHASFSAQNMVEYNTSTPSYPTIRLSTEASDGLEDLDQFLRENMPWSTDQAASHNLGQQSGNRPSSTDSLSLSVPISTGSQLESKTTISRPKPRKPAVSSCSKNLTGNLGRGVKKKAAPKKAKNSNTSCSVSKSMSMFPQNCMGQQSHSLDLMQMHCDKGDMKQVCKSAATSNVNEADSSDSIQCINVGSHNPAKSLPASLNFNTFVPAPPCLLSDKTINPPYNLDMSMYGVQSKNSFLEHGNLVNKNSSNLGQNKLMNPHFSHSDKETPFNPVTAFCQSACSSIATKKSETGPDIFLGQRNSETSEASGGGVKNDSSNILNAHQTYPAKIDNSVFKEQTSSINTQADLFLGGRTGDTSGNTRTSSSKITAGVTSSKSKSYATGEPNISENVNKTKHHEDASIIKNNSGISKPDTDSSSDVENSSIVSNQDICSSTVLNNFESSALSSCFENKSIPYKNISDTPIEPILDNSPITIENSTINAEQMQELGMKEVTLNKIILKEKIYPLEYKEFNPVVTKTVSPSKQCYNGFSVSRILNDSSQEVSVVVAKKIDNKENVSCSSPIVTFDHSKFALKNCDKVGLLPKFDYKADSSLDTTFKGDKVCQDPCLKDDENANHPTLATTIGNVTERLEDCDETTDSIDLKSKPQFLKKQLNSNHQNTKEHVDLNGVEEDQDNTEDFKLDINSNIEKGFSEENMPNGKHCSEEEEDDDDECCEIEDDKEEARQNGEYLESAKQQEDATKSSSRLRLRDTSKSSVKRVCPCCVDSETPKKCRIPKVLSNSVKLNNKSALKTRTASGVQNGKGNKRSSQRLRSRNNNAVS